MKGLGLSMISRIVLSTMSMQHRALTANFREIVKSTSLRSVVKRNLVRTFQVSDSLHGISTMKVECAVYRPQRRRSATAEVTMETKFLLRSCRGPCISFIANFSSVPPGASNNYRPEGYEE